MQVLPARGQRQQKHAAEMAARAKPAPPEAAGGTGIVGPDKNEDGWTISWRSRWCRVMRTTSCQSVRIRASVIAFQV